MKERRRQKSSTLYRVLYDKGHKRLPGTKHFPGQWQHGNYLDEPLRRTFPQFNRSSNKVEQMWLRLRLGRAIRSACYIRFPSCFTSCFPSYIFPIMFPIARFRSSLSLDAWRVVLASPKSQPIHTLFHPFHPRPNIHSF